MVQVERVSEERGAERTEVGGTSREEQAGEGWSA